MMLPRQHPLPSINILMPFSWWTATKYIKPHLMGIDLMYRHFQKNQGRIMNPGLCWATCIAHQRSALDRPAGPPTSFRSGLFLPEGISPKFTLHYEFTYFGVKPFNLSIVIFCVLAFPEKISGNPSRACCFQLNICVECTPNLEATTPKFIYI